MSNILITENYLKNLKANLEKSLPNLKGEKWVIKTHMGEYGNLNYIRPPIVGIVSEALKEKGAKPFVFDTTTRYKYRRFTVKDYLETCRINGFTKETIGCPIIISDKAVNVKTKNLGNVGIAKEIYDSDGMIVLSHFKGHICCGFGGAIKNLGMGAVDSKTKGAIHDLAKPVHDKNKCLSCKKCETVCPLGVIKTSEKELSINYDSCCGCDACVYNCPKKALRAKKEKFAALLAEASAMVLNHFKKNKVLFINVMFDIGKLCDCRGDRIEIVAPDCGIMIGSNAASIDEDCLKLVDKASNGKFTKIYKLDYFEQIREIKKFLK